jgi:peptidoglycan L-alanyl-D-glutamate endopeptidase CwlK
MDRVTLNRIEQSHPNIREELREDYLYCNNKLLGKGVRLRFSSVFRTIEEQNELYNKRPKVTNARGGQSIHNYGLAFDIVMLYDNNLDGSFEEASWDMVRDGDGDKLSDWLEVINFFKSKGYEWGGDWISFKDYPHFQKDFGYSWKELKEKRENGDYLVDSKNNVKYVKL